jgi:hypothetical protein
VIGIQRGPKDWYITKGNTENAIKALLSRAKINRKFDVPDLAGYSENGKDFFIDRGCPEFFDCNGKIISVDGYLILHEEIEIALIKLTHLSYQDTHQCACLGEKEAVETVEGMGCWEPYSAFMRAQINRAWNVKNPKVPPNLYKKPYVDEGEFKKIKEMGYVK